MIEHSNKDSSFWKGNSSRPSDGNSSKPNSNYNMRSFRRAELSANFGTKISNYSNDMATTRIADLSLQPAEEKKIENYSALDNAERNTRPIDIKDKEYVPALARKKKTYHTEQIACSLHDLILGMKSPTIQLAIKKMEEGASQNTSRSSTSSSPIPFEFIVEDQKKIIAKSYNIHVKEFVPSLSKWSPK